MRARGEAGLALREVLARKGKVTSWWDLDVVFGKRVAARLIKELKQDLNLERVPNKDRHAAQVLIWASLVALAVSRTASAALYPSTDRLGLARA